MPTVSSSIVELLVIQSAVLLLLPIVLMIALCVTKKISPIPMLAGVLACLAGGAFLSLLSTIVTFSVGIENLATITGNLPFLILTNGVLNAVCILAATLLGALAVKKMRAGRSAFSFGVGYGLLVAVSTGVGAVSMLYSAMTLNNGTLNAALQMMPEETQKQMQQSYLIMAQQLSSTTGIMVLLSFVQAAAMASFYIFASVLAFKALRERKPLFLLWQFLAGTLFLGGSIVISAFTQNNVYLGVGFLVLCAALCWVYMMRTKPWNQAEVIVSTSQIPPENQ